MSGNEGVLASPSPARSPAWRQHLGVLGAYAALTAIMTWPLVTIFGRAVLGPPGDNLEYVWKLWWFKHALLDLGVSPFFHPGVFYPVGYPVALSETTMAHTLLGLPLTALLGEVAAYNGMMFGSFVLSGYGLYLLARSLGSSGWPSFVAGAAFSFCPYRMSHLGAGHLPLMGTGWIALLFWALERLIQRPGWRRGLAVGLFYGLTGLSSWYYALMVAPFALLYLLLRARPWRTLLWRRALWLSLALGGIVAMVLLAPAAIPLLRLYGEGQARYQQSLAYVDQWSASPLDLVYPNAMHPWWGAALTEGYYQNIQEGLIYLGAVVLALVGVGWRFMRRGVAPRTCAWLALLAAVLALGTTLHWGGEPVYVRVPAAVEQQFSRAMYVLTGRLALNPVSYGALQRPGEIVLPMPTLTLYLFTPFMSAMRVWARFGLLAMLFVAALAAQGVDALLARLRTQPLRVAVGTVLLALVLLDFAVMPYPYGYTEVRGQPVDAWLAQQAPNSPVIQYPLEKTWYGWMLYPQRMHGQPMAYGYGTFVPRDFSRYHDVLSSWPSQEALTLLRQWGVRYVVMGGRSYGEDWPAVRQALEALPGVSLRAELADIPLYQGDRLLHRVQPRAAVPATELVSGHRQVFLQDVAYVYAIE
jgi:hypothetical protein